jgi:hypothetical protein
MAHLGVSVSPLGTHHASPIEPTPHRPISCVSRQELTMIEALGRSWP